MPADVWPIDRRWTVLREDRQVDVTTVELADSKAAVMLGVAGLGKTFELNRLAQYERDLGRDVRPCRLAKHSGSRDELHGYLSTLSATATDNTSIFLDALDESRVPLPRAGLVVADWIGTSLARTGARLRITCRSVVWPGDLRQALDTYPGSAECLTGYLQELTEQDIIAAAAALSIDASRLLNAISNARADVLAQQPLTLSMLFKLYMENGEIPSTRQELFEKGIQRLATDSIERFDIGTNVQLEPSCLLEAAERLACYVLLTGRDLIDLSGDAELENLSWTELERLDSCEPRLNRNVLSAIGSSGLCNSDTSHTFYFAHRLYAEFLAGRRIAKLLPHQGRSLLANPAGWKEGVAGTLREASAFAAMYSASLAQWISTCDPEVIGLSDIADAQLRRLAMLGLLEKSRRHIVTDDQVTELELRGFQYSGAEVDLTPVLRERQDGCGDVVECAVALIESWKLVNMSGALADLVLDPSAPFFARKKAAHAILDFGDVESRARLLPLISNAPGDSENQLRGLAALCNWPDRISPSEMLDVISVPSSEHFHGMYENLLWTLDKESFNAEGCRVKGLKWAKDHIGRLTEDTSFRIAIRIVHGAVREFGDSLVADALYEVLKHCADRRLASPLAPLNARTLDRDDEISVSTTEINEDTSLRRALIDMIAERASDVSVANYYSYHGPRLANLDDFEWLLERAIDVSSSFEARKSYATIAKWIHWTDSPPLVETWLRVREIEPVSSILNFPVLVELDSEIACRQRQSWLDSRDQHLHESIEPLSPPPCERVAIALQRAETEDCRFFLSLCQELTLEPDSTHYSFERFLVETPGWTASGEDVRRRIVDVAKRFLMTDTSEIEEALAAPLSSIHSGGMSAIFLILDRDPEWLNQRLSAWWDFWWWYILRELHIPLDQEANEPKFELFRKLYERVPDQLIDCVARIATCRSDDTRRLYESMLKCMTVVDGDGFHTRLCPLVLDDAIDRLCLQGSAEYLLRRNENEMVPLLLNLLDSEEPDSSECRSVLLCVAMMNTHPERCWPPIATFIQGRSDLGKRILESFIHAERFQDAENAFDRVFEKLGNEGFYSLICLLFDLYPPETDPVLTRVVYRVTPEHEARDWRRQLVSYLGDRADPESVAILRNLEARLGIRYPWLRRPRARAERQLRLAQWTPIPLQAIASLISSNEKRLLRSSEDVVDGIREALQSYQEHLQHDGAVEDLWNTATGAAPSPKREEHVSAKVCGAIREYFERFAVTADREVQIRRRLIARTLNGEPGSELDVLVRVPAVGTISNEAIQVPIEVKRSCNSEARSAINDQLANRYMPQLSATHGVFILVWFDLPDRNDLADSFRPIWSTIEAAREDLDDQVARVFRDSELSIAPVILNARLV